MTILQCRVSYSQVIILKFGASNLLHFDIIRIASDFQDFEQSLISHWLLPF